MTIQGLPLIGRLLIVIALNIAPALQGSFAGDTDISSVNHIELRSPIRTEYLGLGVHLFDEFARKEVSSNTNEFISRLCNAYKTGALGFYIIHVTFDEFLFDVLIEGDQVTQLLINEQLITDIRTLASRCDIPIGLRIFSPIRGEGSLRMFQSMAMHDLFPHTARGRHLWLTASDLLLSKLSDLDQLKLVFWSWEDIWRSTYDRDFARSPNLCRWAHQKKIFGANIHQHCQLPFTLSAHEKELFWNMFDEEIVSAINQLVQLKEKYPNILFGWQPRIDWDDGVTHDRHFDIKNIDFTVLSAATYMADRGGNAVDKQTQSCAAGDQPDCLITDEKQAVNNILLRLNSYKEKIKTPYVLFDQLLSKNWDAAKYYAHISPSKRNSFYEALIYKILGSFHNNNTSVLGLATWGSVKRIHNLLLDATFSDSVSGSIGQLGHWQSRLLSNHNSYVSLYKDGVTLHDACIRQEVPGTHLKNVRTFARSAHTGDLPNLSVSCISPHQTTYFHSKLNDGPFLPIFDDLEAVDCSRIAVELCSEGDTRIQRLAWGPVDTDGFLTDSWLEHMRSIDTNTAGTLQGDALHEVIPEGLLTDDKLTGETNYWLGKNSLITFCSMTVPDDGEIRILLNYPPSLHKKIGPQKLTISQHNGLSISKHITAGINSIRVPTEANGPCISLNLSFAAYCTPAKCNGDVRPISCQLERLDIRTHRDDS